VSRSFGGIKALDDVSLTIPRGSLRCLIGANGAGKSTIFRIIAGEHRPTHGSVWFKGRDITRAKIYKRAHLGISMKMQIPGVYGELSVQALQNRVPKKELGAEIDRLLNRVALTCEQDHLVKNLSHGEVQWLEIAMALGSKPDLLLLDEPTAGMGPGETATTAELVKSLNAEGGTILVIEHDMEFVRQIAQQVTVLHLGRVFTEGTISEIEKNQEVIKIYLGEI